MNDITTPENPIPETATFADLGLHKQILKALAKSGYTTPTPIQEGAIPHALAGTDLLLSAQTGSGKTAAFVLPILDKLANTPKVKPENKDDFSQKSAQRHQKTPVRALILTPTRELAMQVQDNVRKYSSDLRGIFSVPLVGGSPYGGQIRALRKGVQIIIATPGRLIDHMNEGRVELSDLDVLVLDEADRMLDMGFADDINTILQQAPATRQTVMSSATWDGAVGKIAESFTQNPVKIAIKVESGHIDESVYYCDDFAHKNKILLSLLGDDDIKQAVIFTATKRSTEQLAETLTEAGLSARYLHGDLPQGKRNRIISDVKSGKCNFLIATDVAARGIDISNISHVVNYDLPRQVEDYVHRIGRCGRAGRTGVAMNLCSMDDRRQLGHINRYLKRDMKEVVIEGLEPRRPAPRSDKDDKRRGKGRSDKRGGFKNRFERGERTWFGDDKYFGAGDDKPQKRPQRDDREFGEYRRPAPKKPKLAHYGDTSQPRSFDGQGRGRAWSDADRAERGFDDRRSFKTDGFKKSFGEQDGKRFGDRTPKKRFESKGSDGGFEGKRFENRGFESRFGEKDKKPKARGDFYQPKKSKAVEEIFFAKRQEKKAKRKFGEL